MAQRRHPVFLPFEASGAGLYSDKSERRREIRRKRAKNR
jgi:hypothetical protein